ncbi:hypothetical protein PHJA_001936700 [Phtheirospermum japonicum]|uniref:DSBA-like thioredoxin domain-containing protein n=1 Tax=Phtheirospermum japonicum TaxID=374723 RepID=A0A830CFE5_9LAMI|nr:hypothetical protein PHJA_001936700 [Phtheirospermum japonicum]
MRLNCLQYFQIARIYRFITMASVSSNNAKKLIQIDVSADTVCPWCFVGKKNLDKAIASSQDKYTFEIKWHPYMLNPSAPKEGVVKKEYYLNKFGPRAAQMEARMTEIFKGLGMDYDTSGLTAFLVDTAKKVGVEGAAEFLEDPNNGLNEVNEDLKKYSAHINGVPHFVINGKYQLSGGQPPESFLRSFEAAAK